MSKFKERIATPFHKQKDTMLRMEGEGETIRESCRDEVTQWPELLELTQRETLPTWEERMGRMDEHMKPADLRDLYRAKRRLTTLNRLSWKIPAARRIRILNFLYRTGIFTVRLVELAIILAVVFAILWVIWKLA